MEDGGFLGEIISYSRPLNSNERSKLAEYLINKWGNNVCD
jgi:hypothetical protein